ncbi:unnamed protein product [Adineta ricciae]|uniref:Uncharacterized protein n=1 Tax=Adineta ricciae TaxID=249248 RepID=A0A815BBV3_ADIRI|nr:unnamed protein product [Adineta ricciae]
MTETTPEQQVNRCKQLSTLFSKINLYDEKENLSLVDQLLSTQIFLFFFISFLFIITIFAAVSVQTYSETVESPSEALFDYLSLHYRTTLSCPCQQSSISQKNFISFDPHYHPICSSQLTNQSFISLFLFDAKMSEYWPLDYRVMMASHFQILSLFCQSLQQTISSKLEEFVAKQFISNEVLFRDIFEVQITGLFQQMKINTIANNRYMRETIWFTITGNRILSSLRTNIAIQYSPNAAGSGYEASLIYAGVNKSCSCYGLDSCVHQAGIYNWTGRSGVDINTVFGNLNTDPPILFSIPGMLVGCLPYNSLLKSTLECLFDQQCIDTFRTFINILPLIKPLSSSNFPVNTTINELLDNLLIESWNEHINFTNYYHVCSPSTCTYLYNQRFSLVFIILTLTSLFGGLKTVTYFLAPLIVKILQRIKKKRLSNISEQSTSNEKSRRKERCIEFINQICQEIRTLNLFPQSSDVQNGIYSTRLYILFLTIGIIILVVYIAISVRTRSVTILKPTIDQYEELFARYSSTLNCPCSQFSISHSAIVTVQPYYHQICSRVFIKEFLLLYKKIPYIGIVNPFDFRLQYLSWFASLDLLCQGANTTITNQLTTFNDTQFVSGQVLPEVIFRSQMDTLIQQFQNQVLIKNKKVALFFYSDCLLINLDHCFVSSVVSTSSKCNSVWRFYSANDYENQCSCGTNSSCRRPQGFYCRRAGCLSSTSKPNQTIPGLFVSCLSMDSVLISSLECFYNASCIEMLYDWILFEIPNVVINASAAEVTPLDPSVNSRFPIDMTVDEISFQLFIENWTDSVSFINYYHHCAPTECIYTFQERFNLLYLISTILGIAGGLSIALRILIPLFVKFFRRIYHCQYSNRSQTLIKPSDIIIRIRQLNLYRKKLNNEPSDVILIHRQQKATRFYLIIFCLSMIIILVFISFSTQVHSETVSSPRESTFELLKIQYSSTISCPCSQVAIPYSQFLFVNVSAYHQICSSYFISSTFLKRIWGTDTVGDYILYLDAKVLSAQLRTLSSLCTLAKNAIDQKIDIFYSQRLITIEPFTRLSFQTQVNSMIENFISQSPVDFRQTLSHIIGVLRTNQLQNTFLTNWALTKSNAANDSMLSTRSRAYNESGQMCSCATSSTCTRSTFQTGLIINKTVDGIVMGCLPIYGLRFSSLRCFYNSTCLKSLTDFIGITDVLKPLNDSIETRFNPIPLSSIGTLIDELFIEIWKNSSNYSSYYSTCAPLACRYSYTERNSPLYMITTILGLYGGLTVGLKSVIWYVLLLYWKICQYIRNRRGYVEPVTENLS